MWSQLNDGAFDLGGALAVSIETAAAHGMKEVARARKVSASQTLIGLTSNIGGDSLPQRVFVMSGLRPGMERLW